MRYLISLSIVGTLLLSASQASASPKKEAAKHFSEGLGLYQAKDYAGAARELGLSYNLRNDQTTLFAWAQALRLNGDCDESKERLKSYIANGANAKQSKAAFDLMEQCVPKVVEEPDLIVPPVKDPAEDNTSIVGSNTTAPGGDNQSGGDVDGGQAQVGQPWYRDWLGITLLSVGGVGVVLSAVSLNAATTKESDAEKPGVTYDEFLRLRSDAEEARTNAVVFGVAGGLALTGAAVYILMGHYGNNASEDASAGGMAFQFGGQSGSVTYSSSF